MNELIEKGYIIDDLSNLINKETYDLLDKISNDLANDNVKHIDHYEFDYQMKEHDIKELKSHFENEMDSSVRIVDRTSFSEEHRRKMGIKLKKKLLHKYFDVTQIFGISTYDMGKLDEIDRQIKLGVAKKYYSHMFPSNAPIDLTCFNLNNTKRLAVYDEDCCITKHMDGWKEDRLFVMLIYLNKEWTEDMGGKLVIYDKDKNQIEVSPKGLKVCLLDFTQNNLEHEVLKVLSGVRYTYVSFVEVASKIVNNDTWKQHKRLK